MEENHFSQTLSQLRAERGVTQEEVAAALSVSNKTISKWENGDSSPDLSALVELAKFYGVSADYLLGLQSETKSTEDFIWAEFTGMNRWEAGLKLFELLKATIPPVYSAAENGATEVCDFAGVPFPQITQGLGPRDVISVNALFHFLVCSDNVNFAVTQWQNKSNFAWLSEEKAQQKIRTLLTFLADPDVMCVMRFLHSDDCTARFTAQYVAKNTSVSCEKVNEILKQCCEIELCSVMTAHLKTGTTEIYASKGDGLILAILSLAYERMCGESISNYNYGAGSKMVRRERK